MVFPCGLTGSEFRERQGSILEPKRRQPAARPGLSLYLCLLCPSPAPGRGRVGAPVGWLRLPMSPKEAWPRVAKGTGEASRRLACAQRAGCKGGTPGSCPRPPTQHPCLPAVAWELGVELKFNSSGRSQIAFGWHTDFTGHGTDLERPAVKPGGARDGHGAQGRSLPRSPTLGLR